MTRDFMVKQGDTFTAVATLTGRDGMAQDLAEADTVTLFARALGSTDGTAPTIEAALSVVAGEEDEGHVTLELSDVDTAQDPGYYEVEIEVIFSDGQKITFPTGPASRPYLIMQIVDDIGDYSE